MNSIGDIPQLPKGWGWTNLGEITLAINPGFPSGKWQRAEGKCIPHLRPMNIDSKGAINLSEVKYVQSQNTKPLMKGDILFNNTNSPKLIGKTTYIKEDTNWAYSNHMTRIKVHSSINPGYISHYLHHLFSKGFFFSNCLHHVNQASVNTTFLKEKVPVPLAPTAEQGRIVAKVEELFSFLDAGAESLRKVQAQLKRYRQAVLKYAFEGKLTEDWRKTHKNQIEPARQLLDRIKEERTKKAITKLYNSSEVDISNLPQLPEGWQWTKSGNLSWFVTSGSRNWKKYYSDSGPLFIRTENINTNRLSLDNIAHVSLPTRIEGKRSLVEKNDILVIITGANVGKVALVNQEIGEAYVSQSVALLKLVVPDLGRYVHFAMIADGFGKTELSKMVYGMGRPVLSLKNVQEIPLPFAPPLEQAYIVEEIDRRISIAVETEKTIDSSLQHSKAMKQGILRSAFSGKLISQDPNDEPAEKLLKRIKAERFNRESKFHNQLELSGYVK